MCVAARQPEEISIKHAYLHRMSRNGFSVSPSESLESGDQPEPAFLHPDLHPPSSAGLRLSSQRFGGWGEDISESMWRSLGSCPVSLDSCLHGGAWGGLGHRAGQHLLEPLWRPAWTRAPSLRRPLQSPPTRMRTSQCFRFSSCSSLVARPPTGQVEHQRAAATCSLVLHLARVEWMLRSKCVCTGHRRSSQADVQKEERKSDMFTTTWSWSSQLIPAWQERSSSSSSSVGRAGVGLKQVKVGNHVTFRLLVLCRIWEQHRGCC